MISVNMCPTVGNMRRKFSGLGSSSLASGSASRASVSFRAYAIEQGDVLFALQKLRRIVARGRVFSYRGAR